MVEVRKREKRRPPFVGKEHGAHPRLKQVKDVEEVGWLQTSKSSRKEREALFPSRGGHALGAMDALHSQL